LIIFLSNSFGAVVPTAWSTLVPRLSTREDLPRVMGMTQSFFSLAMLAGPAVGGLLVSATGYTWPFIIDSLTFILVASAPFVINVNRPGMQKHESTDQGAFDGLRTIFGDPLLRALSILFSLFVLALGVINVGEVFLVIDILGASPFIYGLIGSIFAIGILIGGLAASAIKVPEFRQASMIISALFLMSISSLLIATAPHWIVIAVFSFTLGFGNAGLQAYASSMIIGRTPEIQRGRVMAGLQALVSIGTLTSFAAAGFLIGVFGVREVLVSGAVIGFLFLVALSPSIILKSKTETISLDSKLNSDT
jgi:MFS family permease